MRSRRVRISILGSPASARAARDGLEVGTPAGVAAGRYRVAERALALVGAAPRKR